MDGAADVDEGTRGACSGREADFGRGGGVELLCAVLPFGITGREMSLLKFGGDDGMGSLDMELPR